MRDLSIDYVVFTLIILISFVLTVYKNISGPKEKTKAEYVLATNRSVSTLPMLLSLARGFLGVRVFIGYPSELYYRGCELWETLYGIILALPISMYFFVPMYLSLGITSVYQYLDKRFKSKLIRCLASAVFILRTVLILAVATYTPCIAIKTVIGVPHYVSISCLVIIAILFSLSGGFGSALLGDVVQGVMMLIVSFLVIVQGTIEAGGPVHVVKAAYDRGRLDFFNFDFDPTKRATTISASIGYLFISVSAYGCQQNFVQRYFSMKSEEKVKRTLLLSIPCTVALASLSWIVGMIIFAQYLDCDPYKLGYIQDIDELFPFYLEDKFLYLPGLLGIVLAILFNGALSNVVTNMNSMATIIWEDFLLDFSCFKNLSDKGQVWMLKFIGLVCGLVILGIALGVSHMTGIIEISIIMISATCGPLLGVFILAIFFPIVNWKGAAIGMITGFTVVMWICIGASTLPETPAVLLPTSTSGCTNETFTDFVVQHRLKMISTNSFSAVVYRNKTNVDIFNEEENMLHSVYRVTYLYYSVIGTLSTVITGWLFNCITGSHAEEYLYKDCLVHPLIRRKFPYHHPDSLEIR